MRTAKFPKQLTVALSQDVYDSIKSESDEREVSMAEVLREWLVEILSQKLTTGAKMGNNQTENEESL